MSRHGENIYLRKDGRYEGRIQVHTSRGEKKTMYVYARKYREVREKLNQLRNQSPCVFDLYEDGRFASWMTHYLQDVIRPHIKESTYQSYCRIACKRLLPRFATYYLSEITDAELNRLYSDLQESGLGLSSARGAIRLLRAALIDAQRKGYVQHVPMCVYRRSVRADPRVLAIPEQAALTSVATGSENLFCLLGLYAGLRVGEICALRWEDWDREHATLYIRHTVQRMTGRGLVVTAPKTEKSVRRVPLPEALTKALTRSQSEQGAANGYIVCGGAEPADPRTIQRRLQKLCRKVNLHGVHMHTLRHSYATRLLEAGVDVKTLSTLLGHSSVQITIDRYCHTSFDRMCGAIQQLDSYMRNTLDRQ